MDFRSITFENLKDFCVRRSEIVNFENKIISDRIEEKSSPEAFDEENSSSLY